MATFESISAAANSGAGSTSPTCTMSASAVAGSYAIAAVDSGGNTANQPLSVSSGSGETWEFLAAIPQGSTQWLSFFGKRVSAADINAAVNCTLAGGGAHYDMAVITYSSCDGVDGILWNVVGGAGSTTVSPQAIRPRFDAQTVVCIIGCSGTAAASAIATASTNYTKRYDDVNTATAWKELFIQDRTLGAGTGWITETPSNLTNSQTVTVAAATLTLLDTGQRRSTSRPFVVPPSYLRLHRQQRHGPPLAAVGFTQTLLAAVSAMPQPISLASQSFEDGTVGGWTAGGSNPPTLANSTAQAKDGTHALLLTQPTGTGGLGVSPGQVTINVPAIGIVVPVRVWVYVPSGGMPTVRGTINGTAAFTAISSVNDAWQLLTLSFTTTALTHVLAVYPTGATTAGQFFYLDSVYVDVGQYQAAIAATRAVVEAAARSTAAAVTATRSVAEAAARALKAAVTGTRSTTVTDTAKAVEATSTTRTATEAPARALQAAVTATRPVTESPARALLHAITGTRAVTEAPARALQAAVAATRKVTETVAASATNGVSRLQTVAAVETTIARVTAAVSATRPVVETVTRKTLEVISTTSSVAQAPARRVSAAVTAARTATQVPARIVKAAVTASLKTTEAAAPGSLQGPGKTVTVTEAPARALRAAVAAARAAVEAPALKRSAAVTATRAVLEAPVARVLAGVARTYRATTTVTASLRAGIGQKVRATVGYLFHLVNSKGQGHQAPDRFLARLDGPPWTARANDTAWSAAARTRGGLMYHQLAVSDTAIPVLITSKFGLDPTGDPVVYAVLDPDDPAPAQADIQLQATWYTDPDGKHWAMCPAGPNSTYHPTAGTVKALYVMIGDATNVVCDPVTVKFD